MQNKINLPCRVMSLHGDKVYFKTSVNYGRQYIWSWDLFLARMRIMKRLRDIIFTPLSCYLENNGKMNYKRSVMSVKINKYMLYKRSIWENSVIDVHSPNAASLEIILFFFHIRMLLPVSFGLGHVLVSKLKKLERIILYTTKCVQSPISDDIFQLLLMHSITVS